MSVYGTGSKGSDQGTAHSKESGLEMPVLNLCMTRSLLNNHLGLSINSMLVIFFGEKVLGIHKINAKHGIILFEIFLNILHFQQDMPTSFQSSWIDPNGLR